jgi:hypothetical protein
MVCKSQITINDLHLCVSLNHLHYPLYKHLMLHLHLYVIWVYILDLYLHDPVYKIWGHVKVVYYIKVKG